MLADRICDNDVLVILIERTEKVVSKFVYIVAFARDGKYREVASLHDYIYI